jgi:uncharacterized membrane protein
VMGLFHCRCWHEDPSPLTKGSALNERYAKGEIERSEYDEKRCIISQGR